MNNIQKLLPLTSNKTIPMLETLLVESDEKGEVTVSATDLQTYAVVPSSLALPANAKFAIQASKFIDILTAVGVTAELSITETHLVVKHEKSKYQLPILPADDFPTQPDIVATQSVSFDSISSIVSDTLWAVSKDELRPSMSGVLFDKSCVVATDAYKLVRKDYAISNDDVDPFIVPGKSMSIIESLFGNNPVDVGSDGNRAYFSSNSISVFVKLIDEKYPNYDAVIPKDGFTGSIKVNVKRFQESISRLRIASDQKTNLISMSVSSDGVELSASNIDYSLSGIEYVDAVVSGEPITIGFNGDFMLSALRRISEPTVELSYIAPERPMILSDVDKIILIMPTLIQKA